MMNKSGTLQQFLSDSQSKTFDIEHRKKLNYNISRYDKTVEKGRQQYADLELAKQRAAHLKNIVTRKLDKYLIEFESNFVKRGGKVVWASDGREAINKILIILKKYGAKTVVKGKSMTTEEIHFNEALKANNIDSVETDLGEYIVQLAGEAPYHIVT